MTTVFMPVHQRMMELVLDRADLIEEPDMPPCLLDLCAHVNGYQAVLKEWETGQISTAREDNISVVNFPGQELAEYAAAAFSRLKAEQARPPRIDCKRQIGRRSAPSAAWSASLEPARALAGAIFALPRVVGAAGIEPASRAPWTLIRTQPHQGRPSICRVDHGMKRPAVRGGIDLAPNWRAVWCAVVSLVDRSKERSVSCVGGPSLRC